MDLVVISGKGGTGKTTIAAALSELVKDVTRVDCDVDAANLHLYYDGEDIDREDFYAGKVAYIDEARCIRCGNCKGICRFDAIENFKVIPFACEGCGACTLVCPRDAIELKLEKDADAYITQLEEGILSRAELKIGSDGSGMLITLLRKNARRYIRDGLLTIIDGSPGIGCPVIASITGSDAVLIVTEPTQSGLSDLERVLKLSRHFGINPMVCINKYDINEGLSSKIEGFLREEGLQLVGKIPFDDTVMQSIHELKPIIYYEDSSAAKAIKDMWLIIKKLIFEEEWKDEDSNCK